MSSSASNIGPVPYDTPFLEGQPWRIALPWFIFLEKVRSRRIAPSSGTGALVHDELLTADVAIAGPGAPAADGDLLRVFVEQDGTGDWEITWGADFHASTPVTIGYAAAAVTLFSFTGKGGIWWPDSPALYF